jgi:molybdopterin converting factor small subunit
VNVTYYGLINNLVDKPEDKHNISNGSTVQELLHTLVQKYGDNFRSLMLTPDWKLLPSTIIHLNGRDINEIEGMNTKLADDSEVSISVIKHFIGGG